MNDREKMITSFGEFWKVNSVKMLAELYPENIKNHSNVYS
ncbi:hypothetical protein BAPA111461_26290 [Bacillus paramycoides]